MFTVELYAGIRRAVMVDGLSRLEAAKRFGVHGALARHSSPELPTRGAGRIQRRGRVA